MEKVKHDLLTSNYTEVYHESKELMNFNAPNHFQVVNRKSNRILSSIDFQEGPIKEHGINGVNNEDLIAMVVTRLEHFQKSDFACRENEEAIKKFEEGLLWLRKRTMGREQRGVEGTHTV